jgi:hypothetical protein
MALGAVWVRLPLVALSAIAGSQSQRYVRITKGSVRLFRRLGGSISQIQGAFIIQV